MSENMKLVMTFLFTFGSLGVLKMLWPYFSNDDLTKENGVIVGAAQAGCAIIIAALIFFGAWLQ